MSGGPLAESSPQRQASAKPGTEVEVEVWQAACELSSSTLGEAAARVRGCGELRQVHLRARARCLRHLEPQLVRQTKRLSRHDSRAWPTERLLCLAGWNCGTNFNRYTRLKYGSLKCRGMGVTPHSINDWVSIHDTGVLHTAHRQTRDTDTRDTDTQTRQTRQIQTHGHTDRSRHTDTQTDPETRTRQ